jgi:hypothetical protein
MSHGGRKCRKVEKDPKNKMLHFSQCRIKKKSILPYHFDGTHCQHQNLKRKAKNLDERNKTYKASDRHVTQMYKLEITAHEAALERNVCVCVWCACVCVCVCVQQLCFLFLLLIVLVTS